MLYTCEKRGTQHMISIQKLRFSSHLRPSGLQELGKAQPANLLRLTVILIFVWFLVQGNIALFKPTSQSRTFTHLGISYPASNAVDGNRNPDISKCTRTLADRNPWWRVDLGRVEPVAEVNIVKSDTAWVNRLDGAEIRVGR